MFGRLLGKVLSTPIRIVNVPLKVFDKLTDPCDYPGKSISKRDPLALDKIADAVDDAADS